MDTINIYKNKLEWNAQTAKFFERMAQHEQDFLVVAVYMYLHVERTVGLANKIQDKILTALNAGAECGVALETDETIFDFEVKTRPIMPKRRIKRNVTAPLPG